MATGAGRVLVAKPGLDGHDKGATVVSIALRDAGFEVIYLGRHQTISTLAQTAIEEDIDVVGLSILSGTHIPYSRELLQALRDTGNGDGPGAIRVVVGGTVPPADVEKLLDMGVTAVFPSGTSLLEVVNAMKEIVTERRRALGFGGGGETVNQ